VKPRYIHIGSWNIEHFGKDDNNPDNQFAIAEHIEMSGVHVLALQEMYVTTDNISNPAARLENSFFQAALDLVEEHTGQRWDYELFRNRNLNDKSQLCGVAWNTARVRKEGDTFRIGVSNTATEGATLNLWDRHPHAVKFAAVPGEDATLRLTDFVVIPMHMKSNVGQRHTVMRTRFHEVRELMQQMPAVRSRFNEDDIILLGDTNCKNRDEDAVQTFINNGFEDLNEDDIPTYVSGDDAPFDRIFIPRGENRKTFRFSRQYILRSASPLAHDRYLSDHYMVKTSIVIRRDDD
jgi:hypothetical protein